MESALSQRPPWSYDEYVGAFVACRFKGLGVFTWATGAKLSGLFEDNFCNRVGRKIYRDGRIYTGELRHDLEHGKGLLIEGGKSFVGFWEQGKVVKRLIMSTEPELEFHVICGDQDTAENSSASDTGSSRRERSSRNHLLPVHTGEGHLVNGKAVVDFLNGDRYCGRMKSGRKHGFGMYVYADRVTYKGIWNEDALNGVRHPVTEGSLPMEVKLLQDDNFSLQDSSILASKNSKIISGADLAAESSLSAELPADFALENSLERASTDSTRSRRVSEGRKSVLFDFEEDDKK